MMILLRLLVFICLFASCLCQAEYETCVAACSPHAQSVGPPGKVGPPGQKGDSGDICMCCERLEDVETKVNEKLKDLSECKGTTMKFPRRSQTSDYIRVKAPFPETKEITICARFQFSNTGLPPGTLISYSTLGQFNSFLILNNDVAFMHTEFRIPNNLGPAGERAHFCLAIRVGDTARNMRVFIDGIKAFEQDLFTPGSTLPSGGYFLIGQEQDSLMGGFDANQAYYGDIENMQIWDKALSNDEVEAIYNKCPCDTNAKVVPDENNVQLYGAATLVEDSFCGN